VIVNSYCYNIPSSRIKLLIAIIVITLHDIPIGIVVYNYTKNFTLVTLHVERSEAGSQFHIAGPLTAKLRWPIVVLVRGTSSIPYRMTPTAGVDDLGRTQLAHRGHSKELYCGGTSTPIPLS